MKISVVNIDITSRGEKGDYLPVTCIKTMAEALGDSTKGIPSPSSMSITGTLKAYLYENNLNLTIRFPINGKGANHIPALVWMTYVKKYFPKLAKAVAADYWIAHIYREDKVSKMDPIPNLDDQVFAIHSDAVAKVRKLAETNLKDVLNDIISDAHQIVYRDSERSQNALPAESSAVEELIAVMVRHVSRGATFIRTSETTVKYYDSNVRPLLDALRTVKGMAPRTGELVLRLPRRGSV